MFKEDCLRGQAGIVTGGSSGIGLAIAEYLTKHGAAVTITGRDPDKLKDAADRIVGSVTVSAGDVRKSEDVARNIQDHMETFGKVDFLVNNAAGNFLCPMEKMSENAFRSVLEIVTMGTFLWSKAVQPHMKAAGSGRIVNIGTTYSWNHGANVAHSGASKAAVLNLTKTMAVEWGPLGILTNLIAPGPVEGTEGVRRLVPNPKLKAMLLGMMPVPRLAEGWEIAAMVVFLLSPLGSYINGAAIPIDGGNHLLVPGLLPGGISLEG